jgi:hypothetical protein
MRGGAEKKARFSEDSFWKGLAGDYFYPLLKRALPELYRDADTGKKPRFLSIAEEHYIKKGTAERHFSDLRRLIYRQGLKGKDSSPDPSPHSKTAGRHFGDLIGLLKSGESRSRTAPYTS